MENTTDENAAVDAAPALPEPPDLSAFERAAALLNRNEHLDDTYEQWQKKTQPRGGAGRRQITVPPPPRRPRKPAHPEFEPPPASTPLPSLAELSQSDILNLKKSTHVPRAGRRAGAVPLSADESRKAAMSTMEAALPSLDEESARLVARAFRAPPPATRRWTCLTTRRCAARSSVRPAPARAAATMATARATRAARAAGW